MDNNVAWRQQICRVCAGDDDRYIEKYLKCFAVKIRTFRQCFTKDYEKFIAIGGVIFVL